MKLNKFLLSAAVLFTTALSLQAQSYETSSKWQKKNEPCVAINVNAPEEIAIESLFSLLKSERLKGKKSGKTLNFEKVILPSISSDYVNIHAKAEAKDNNNSTVYVFVNKGDKENFISSSSDRQLVDGLMEYLDAKYEQAAAKTYFDFKIDTQKNLIKDSEKNLKNMQKDFEKKTKQKEKLEKELEELTLQIEQQGILLEQQNEDLKKIEL